MVCATCRRRPTSLICRLPDRTLETYVRSTPSRSASCSCVRPCCSMNAARTRPTSEPPRGRDCSRAPATMAPAALVRERRPHQPHPRLACFYATGDRTINMLPVSGPWPRWLTQPSRRCALPAEDAGQWRHALGCGPRRRLGVKGSPVQIRPSRLRSRRHGGCIGLDRWPRWMLRPRPSSGSGPARVARAGWFVAGQRGTVGITSAVRA
jgi:hypothetical protein